MALAYTASGPGGRVLTMLSIAGAKEVGAKPSAMAQASPPLAFLRSIALRESKRTWASLHRPDPASTLALAESERASTTGDRGLTSCSLVKSLSTLSEVASEL